MKKTFSKLFGKALILAIVALPFVSSAQTLDYSFVMLGCNRVDAADTIGNPSTANVYQLNRVFTEVSQMNPLPKYLFFVGDLVIGYENDTAKLARQLTSWLNLYYASPLYGTSVQLVVVEGNHETQDKNAGKKSFVAAERTFVRTMGAYILGNNGPTITGLVPGTDSLTTDQSKLTYSFNYHNDHFVVVNTDPVGRDAIASYKWIANDIATARANGARHVFAFGHKPGYTGHFKSTPDGLDVHSAQRDSLWKKLELNQADAFFSAHIHVSDTLEPHKGETWQVIAGNGGSLVEPTFTSPPNAYFGYVVASVYTDGQVHVDSWGRDAVMTASDYTDATPNNPTTLRASYNIGINPVIDHTPLTNTSSFGPFTVTATITDNVAVTSAQLNYKVNGVSQTALTPSINGSTYTFTIPAQIASGNINYNIQANDVSLVKLYSTGSSSSYHTFTYGGITGPNSSQTPYLLSVAPGVQFTSILSANDSVNHYKMSGTPDGLGAFDNGDGTFTMLMNHEFTSTQGINRAHGSNGSFISKWIINKQDLSVVSGSDEIQNVYLWDNTTSTYTLYNAANPSTNAIFQRFCSADLPPVSAFYNSATGKGTQERIYMNGEEVSEGRAMAHIITGPYAGNSWQLPWFGKLAWENAVANATPQDKTIVAGLDDATTTTANVYFYIGTKTNTGTDIDKAGLNNGTMYAVKVTGFPQERVNSTTINNPPAPGTHFDLVNIGSVLGLTGAQVDANSLTAGATYFSRVEDGTWNPANLNDFYFHTTDQLDQVNDGVGTQVGRSRLWHLHFTDIANPELGGTIEAVLDGTEGQNMFDNITMDLQGNTQNLEDVGNTAHNGKIFNYNTATDVLTMIGKHDPARFGDIGVAATAPFNVDEETSGVIDVQSLLGPGMYLIDDQAHYFSVPVDIVEGGQLLAYYNPLASDCSNFSATISPAGSVTMCRGNEVTLIANGGYGFSYQWYKGNSTIVGATNSSYTTDKKGNYYVVESNGTCSWTSASTNINFISTPSASIVGVTGLDLCGNASVTLKAVGGSSTSTYAWSKDGAAISGATSKKIIVSEAGSYEVTVTNTNGCSATAAAIEVVKTCKLDNQQNANATSLNLYPNPSEGNFVIELNLNDGYNGNADIQMINTLGQVVYSNVTTMNDGQLQLEVNPDRNLANGNYFVRVIAGDTVLVKQVAIQK